MKDFVGKNLTAIEWVLGSLAVLLPTAAWLSRNELGDLTLYDIFPPLGLIAFGLMWTHFVVGALRRYGRVEKRSSGLYMPLSMGLVLALIILHPGLLWLALYMDGYGLPPKSYMEVYSTQIGFVSLGVIGLTIFLSYELKRFFGQRSWWKYIDRLQIAGMIAIFIHGFGLGQEIRMDWFMLVWLVYGVTFLVSIVYSWRLDNKKEDNHAA